MCEAHRGQNTDDNIHALGKTVTAGFFWQESGVIVVSVVIVNRLGKVVQC